jgi:MFS family permease
MERPIYNALIGLCWGTGCIVGPIIGGGFSSSSATWRWAFYINLPLAACCSPIYVFLNPNFNPMPDTPLRTKIAQIDWVGVVLNAIVFTFFQVVLTLAGSTWRWDSAGPIVFWVFFGICLIVFALQQVYCVFTSPEHRLFPVQFLKHRTHVLLYFATACSATTTFVTIYYVPLFFQFTKGDTAIHAAVRLLPFITVMVTFVMFSGGSLPKVGRYMPYYIASGALMIIGAALMHTVDSQTSEGKIYGYEVLLAAGAGLSLQTAYTVIVVKVLPQEVPAGIGFINVAQIGSITIALSIAGSIFQNVGFRELSAALAQFNFSEADLRNALGGVESTILAAAGQVQTLALEAIVRTIGKIWIMSIAAGALCFVSGILMSPEKLELEMTAGG